MKPKSPPFSTESIAGVLFNPEKTAVLLIQRRDVPVWVLPGGGIDSGELPQDAVIREILEETGLTVKAERIVGIYLPINRLARKTFLYECTFVSGTPALSNETKGVSFFPIGELPPLPPPYREWIEDAKKGGPSLIKPLKSVTYTVLFKYFCASSNPRYPLSFIAARSCDQFLENFKVF